MIDTSIWIDHIRHTDEAVVELLASESVLMHSFVLGELAVGNMHDRDAILRDLQELPQAAVATFEEVLRFVERNALFGIGISYIDASLLASVRLTPGASLWTRDKRLLAAEGTILSRTTKLH